MAPVYLNNRNFVGYAERSMDSSDNSNKRSSYECNSKENQEKNSEVHDDIGMSVNYVRIKALENSIRKDIISDKYSLHRAITPVLTVAYLIGLLPVQGIKGRNTSYLVFNWFSWQVLYVFVVLFSCLIIVSLSLIKISKDGLTYKNTSELLFFGSSLVIYILFIHLAREWPKIMAKYELMEREMKQIRRTTNIAFRLKMLTSIIMSLSIIEYAAIVLTGMMKVIPCSKGGLDIFRPYFIKSYYQVFTAIDYSLLYALPIGFLHLILSCAWNFMDLFLIVLTDALSEKFKTLNQRLDYVNGKVLPNTYWRKSRETYNILALLTEDFDEFLSPVILLSFAHNLYFICLQLLNSLKPMHSIWEALCFVFLFTYLVGRTCAVTLYAASINDESKKPKFVLFSVPTECYGVEVARFTTQVTANELAMTGYNFFSVTRTFMLTIAGTIVTYEIVLIQFNSVSNEMVNQNNTLIDCP